MVLQIDENFCHEMDWCMVVVHGNGHGGGAWRWCMAMVHGGD